MQASREKVQMSREVDDAPAIWDLAAIENCVGNILRGGLEVCEHLSFEMGQPGKLAGRRPVCSQKAFSPRTNMVRVPSTHTSDCAAVLGDIPPPCSRGARGGKRNVPLEPPMASCSPVGGRGRLVPPTTVVRMSAGETVKAPARMPAHDWASTPSHGGREGIIGTGVSRRPEVIWRNASFLYYSYRRK